MSSNEVLSFGIGGFSYGNQSISVQGSDADGYVAYCRKAYSADDVEEREVALEVEQVTAFFQAAEDLGVFEWEARYMKSPMDGSDWDLSVDYGEHAGFASRGYSAQPQRFTDFMTLLKDLGF